MIDIRKKFDIVWIEVKFTGHLSLRILYFSTKVCNSVTMFSNVWWSEKIFRRLLLGFRIFSIEASSHFYSNFYEWKLVAIVENRLNLFIKYNRSRIVKITTYFKYETIVEKKWNFFINTITLEFLR